MKAKVEEDLVRMYEFVRDHMRCHTEVNHIPSNYECPLPQLQIRAIVEIKNPLTSRWEELSE